MFYTICKYYSLLCNLYFFDLIIKKQKKQKRILDEKLVDDGFEFGYV